METHNNSNNQIRFSSLIESLNPEEFLTSWDEQDYLGCGSFGSVRVCQHQVFGSVVAKCFAITGIKETTAKRKQGVKREANALSRLRCNENVVKIHGVTTWDDNVGIILEHVDGGDLESYLKSSRLISWETRLSLARQLANALCYLHNYAPGKVFCHGDVKPENILLTRSLVLKLADFGAVNIIKATGLPTTTCECPPTKQHTMLYTAPEFLRNEMCESTTWMDMYSFALVLWEMTTRKTIYAEKKYHQSYLFGKIAHGGLLPCGEILKQAGLDLDLDADRNIFQILVEVIRSCLKNQPQERMSSKEALQKLTAASLKEARSSFYLNMGEVGSHQLSGLRDAQNGGAQVKLSEFSSPFKKVQKPPMSPISRYASTAYLSQRFNSSISDLTDSPFTTRRRRPIIKFVRNLFSARKGPRREVFHFEATLKFQPAFANGNLLFYSYHKSFSKGILFKIRGNPMAIMGGTLTGAIEMVDLGREQIPVDFTKDKATNVLQKAFPKMKKLKLKTNVILAAAEASPDRCVAFALNNSQWNYPNKALLVEQRMKLKVWSPKKGVSHGTLACNSERYLEDFAVLLCEWFGEENVAWFRYSPNSTAEYCKYDVMELP